MRIETGKAENTVIGIFGYKGSFKTTVLTFLLHEDFLALSDRKVFSNYKLSFKFDWLKAEELILDIDKFNNTIIGIDELHEYADSRNSSSFQNRLISSFFLQSRHTNSNVYYTSQYEDQIDKRIIRITDIIIYCNNLYTDMDN